MTRRPRASWARDASLALSVMVTAAVGGCTSDSILQVERSTGRIDRPELVGNYVGARIIFVDGADTTDLRANGAFFNLTLAENSGVAGHLFIPAAGAGGADIDADMTGAWTFDLVGQIVRFAQQVDTFVRESDWPASRDAFAIELHGTSVPDEAEPGTSGIEVVLRKG